MPPAFLRAVAGGVELLVHVQPGAAKSAVAGEHGGRLKIRLGARPVEGAANDELVRYLAELAELPRRQVTLVRGERSREKTVRLEGVTPEAIERALVTG